MKPLRILLVEDEPVNREVLDLMLQSLGHGVVPAESGAEALAALRTQRFDLVLSDLRMPHLDGEQLLREIRALDIQADLPVIAITADVMSHPAEYYLSAGFTGFVTKPLTIPTLGRCLECVSMGIPAIDARPPRRCGV